MWGWFKRSIPDEGEMDEDTGILDRVMDEDTEPMGIACAWCLAEQGIVPTSGSHGICPLHAQQVLEAARERRKHRTHGGS